ncbi:hypothetical protein AHF37_07986 [Paragonimus kellicotti]|nr:hypothetical protein AHF37_07986 [Paragonimus kellicotti]
MRPLSDPYENRTHVPNLNRTMHDLTGSSGCRLSQFSLSRPFMLSVLTLISLLCTTQCEQNLSHYTYSVRSGPSKEFVQLTCPLHYAQLGDEVVYYKLNVFDQKPDLLRIVPINSDTTVESVHYPVHQWSPDLHIYCEIQRNSDGAKNIISRTDFIFNALSASVVRNRGRWSALSHTE